MASEVVRATDKHAQQLAASMRPEDVAEVFASHGTEPLETLRLGLALSQDCRALMIDGEVAAMFGTRPFNLLEGVAEVWLLSGKAVDAQPMAFARKSKEEIRRLSSMWPTLFTAADARYQKTLRWLGWLGFQILEPIPQGPAGMPFHPAVLRSP